MLNIKLSDIKDVENLVRVSNKYNEDIDITHGRIIADGKSFLGVAALISNYVCVRIVTDNEDILKEFKQDIIRINGQCDES